MPALADTGDDCGPAALMMRRLGLADYQKVWRDMQSFTAARTATTQDELWLLEHPPVFTLGRNAKHEHLLDTGTIPVIQVDRGGQVTYHGPGQLVAYTLLDLNRRGLGVQSLVKLLEQAVIDLLAQHPAHVARLCAEDFLPDGLVAQEGQGIGDELPGATQLFAHRRDVDRGVE